MEEDDPTPHALPRWVELEYKVRASNALSQNVIIKRSLTQNFQKIIIFFFWLHQHMRTLAGPTASSVVAFTNLSSASSASLSAAFSDSDPAAQASSQQRARAECHEQGVLALMKSRDVDVPLERVCLLDPKASSALTPSDGDAGKFTWFLFGVRPPLSLSLSLPSFDPFPALNSTCVFSFFFSTARPFLFLF